MTRPITSLSTVKAGLDMLNRSVTAGLNRTSCLRRWSEFIRERDDYRCVDCHATSHLSAHHICRKVFLPEAEFQTGNGITLCRECHREVHQGFNGRPDLHDPMDAQGGEKLRSMERLYCILDQDAVDRDMLRLGFYELTNQTLSKFKIFQGFSPDAVFPGPPVRQAYLIWAQTSLNVRKALADANGTPMTDDPILPGEAFLVVGGDAAGQRTIHLKNSDWY